MKNEMCQVCGENRAVHIHHRQLRSQGGTDEPANLLPVCLNCHNWIHANPSEAYARGLLVHSWADPSLVRMFTIPEKEEPEHIDFHPSAARIIHVDVEPGHDCPTCKRRIPLPKKKTSPKTEVFSTRVPIGDKETFQEMVDAAAEHIGIKTKPHFVYNTLLVGLALILQAAKEDLPS